MRFIFGKYDWNDIPCSHLWQWCISLESRPLNFPYCKMHIDADKSPFITNMHTKSIQKQIVEYDIKSKYPEEHSTVN